MIALLILFYLLAIGALISLATAVVLQVQNARNTDGNGAQSARRRSHIKAYGIAAFMGIAAALLWAFLALIAIPAYVY